MLVELPQKGYALILVMVALVVLTILGVTSITAAQLDMKITQNLRHHKQIQYGGMAGLDHAKDMAEDASFQPFDSYEAAALTPGNCTTDWISTATTAVATPLVLEANGFQLSTYSADLCSAVCNRVSVGNQLNQTGEKGLINYTLDIVSTGSMDDSTSSAQMGGLLFSPPTQGKCNGLL